METSKSNLKGLYIGIAIVFLLTLSFGYLLDGLTFVITLIGLSIAANFQNMSFTWSSRSRNSGDPDHHRYAAWGSNGVWIITQSFIAANVYAPITNMYNDGVSLYEVAKVMATYMVYTIATAEGSVLMMKIMLGRVKVPILSKFLLQTGKRSVGAK